MSENPHDRAPCPDRIIDDVGGAFGMGAVGGSIWHAVAGIRNSPRGERLLGGSQAVRINAPRLGGSFAVWGGCFAASDCTLVYLRQKEDPWNSIASGFLTGGFLQLRQGPRAALSSAVFGGVLLGFIEGLAIMLNRMTAQLPPPPPPQAQLPAPKPQAPSAGLPSASPLPSAPLGYSGSPSITDSAVLLPSAEAPLDRSASAASTSAGAPAQSAAAKSAGSGWGWLSWGGGSKDKKRSEVTAPAAPAVGDTLLVDTAPPAMPDFALKDDSWTKSSR